MPELTFVLPHWMYWGGLVLFPLMALLIFHNTSVPAPGDKLSKPPLSLSLAYIFLIIGGFLGIHRLYLKSIGALLFVALFVGILSVNTQVRSTRDAVSGANNAVNMVESRITRAQKLVKKGRRGATAKLEKARQRLNPLKAERLSAQEAHQRSITIARLIGGLLVLLMLIDALRLPKLVRTRNALEVPPDDDACFHCPLETDAEPAPDPTAFGRAVSRLNGVVGEFVAYWSIIAVGVYYYEVVARYVFNSPTNWAHEGMFLMFGMQYLLAGGFVLREGNHVRVDVLYVHMPQRCKAIVDLLTSVFFFIFTITLMFVGWTFFYDSFEVREVSFSEWAISYWPIKFSLPLGALLLLLQGIAQVLKDLAVLLEPSAARLDGRLDRGT